MVSAWGRDLWRARPTALGGFKNSIGVAWNTMISNQCPIVLFAFTEQECWAGLSVAEATIDLAKALESRPLSQRDDADMELPKFRVAKLSDLAQV